jgi:alcohol dehydrogenase, propanol-preferring
MKAAVLHEFKKPLAIEEVAQPQLSADDVLIEIEVCGVCHSDLHIADDDWTQLSRIVKKPLILGHEIVGRVVTRGAAVRSIEIGDRVGVPWLQWTCGECEFCREGNENLCVKQRITGVTVDGGYAEYTKAPASHVVKIPEGLPSEQAAPLLCAGVTVHRALKHAIDVSEEKLALARFGGALRTLNATKCDVVKEIRASGRVHVALVTSAAKNAYDMAFYCVRPTGTLLAVGLPAQDISFPPILMAASEIHIKASSVGTREDLREILAMAAAGTVHCQVTIRALAEVCQVLEEFSRGQICGRVVLGLR